MSSNPFPSPTGSGVSMARHRGRRTIRIGRSGIAGCVALLSLEARPASLTPLGDLPGGPVASYAGGVSSDGTVVVGFSAIGSSASQVVPGYSTSPWQMEAFRWAGGVMSGLGDLAGGPFYSAALGVSGNGGGVVGQGHTGAGLADGGEAFHWSAGVMSGLGGLGGSGFVSLSRAISRDGSTVVGTSWSGPSGTVAEAFRWQGGVMVGLGDLAGGGVYSEAYGVSAGGGVVVGTSDSGSGYGPEAFRWDGSTMTGLGDLNGGLSTSTALGVSGDGGVVVGWSDNGSGDTEAFVWEGGTMLGLGDLAGGGFFSRASAISWDGSTIVGMGSTEAGETAFVWREAWGMRSLEDLLVERGILPWLDGWSLLGPAQSVSDDGRFVVGTGFRNGNPEAYLADIGGEVVPEPSTWLTIAGLGAGLLLSARPKSRTGPLSP